MFTVSMQLLLQLAFCSVQNNRVGQLVVMSTFEETYCVQKYGLWNLKDKCAASLMIV